MCGIAAWFRHPTKLDEKTVHTVMSLLFPRLILEVEERGTDATGLYQVYEDGEWLMAKTGRKASEWLSLTGEPSQDDPIYFDDFVKAWDEHPTRVRSVVAHCRKATAGSYGSKNEDNHPFAVQLDNKNAILGVHNGTLINHERIFTRLSELGSPLERNGKVDSEALFHLLYHASDAGVRTWETSDLYSVARKVDGAYALIAANSRFPTHIAVMRDDRPLEACFIQPIGVMILASEKRFIDKALANYETVRRHLMRHLPALQSETQMIADRTCRIFDLTKELPDKPKYGILDEVSLKADLNPRIRAFPDDEWKVGAGNKTTTSSTSSTSSCALPKKEDDTPAVKTSKTVVPGPIPAPPPATSKPVEAPIQATITIPDNRTEDEDTLIREARYLDLCPTFKTKPELAQFLGVSPVSLDSMGGTALSLDVINRVCETAFVQGYSLGNLDSEKEIKRIQQTGKTQAEKLEAATDKWQKAQKALWEMKVLLLCYKYLEISKLALTTEHLRTFLTSLPNMGLERAAKILKMHEQITEGKVIKALKASLEEAKQGTAE